MNRKNYEIFSQVSNFTENLMKTKNIIIIILLPLYFST